MWSRLQTCNNVTRHVFPYRSIGVLREIQVQYFIATCINSVFFKCTIRPLYSRGKKPRHPLKRRPVRADGYDGRFGYKTKRLLHWVSNHKLSNTQSIVLSLHWMTHRVSTRNTNGTKAVELCYGTYTLYQTSTLSNICIWKLCSGLTYRTPDPPACSETTTTSTQFLLISSCTADSKNEWVDLRTLHMPSWLAEEQFFYRVWCRNVATIINVNN